MGLNTRRPAAAMASRDGPFARRSGHLRRSLHANIRQRRGRRDAGGAQHRTAATTAGAGSDRFSSRACARRRPCRAHDRSRRQSRPLDLEYGSVVTTVYRPRRGGRGQRARPRRAHALSSTPRTTARGMRAMPGVQAALWAQYALDTAASVDEALAATGRQVQTDHGRDRAARADTEGTRSTWRSRTRRATRPFIEYHRRQARSIHHGREFRVMTNASVL